ncbi:hypothetical protein FJR48_01145 [Sulfurimonas lithotrophica]|uniref:Uncharacterized protein n=1 Tax=Sulfurimonas lithotrophica TaxID=2590022 RepID=A0A5P8NYB3_9BACT|nr:hypothetical protein [Sulfurimonas lithotrophica]QFR48400.1 hypothetical protein FJR48_01145 [Sulfurimonas lithotrophica]
MDSGKLIFSRADSQSGLTNASISASNDKDASVIIRELLQNSFDSAIDDAKKKEAQVKIVIDTINKSEIPGISEYNDAIEAIEKEELSSQEENILSAIQEELSKDTIPIMYVIDNGIGFNQETLVSILSDGISKKSDPMNSGGSYGNGHFSAFNISNLRYVLYGGKSDDGQIICSGQALLRTHRNDGTLKNGAGFLRTEDEPIIEENDIFLKDGLIPNIISKELSHLEGSGAVVAMVGFNFFGKENPEKEAILNLMSSSIIRNFFVAISEKHLKVDIVWDDDLVSINEDSLERIFHETKNEKSNPIYQTSERFYKLLYKGHQQLIATKEGDVKVYYLESDTNTKLALCRNGMWINDSIPTPLNVGSFSGNKPFSALILPQRDTELSALIKGAEGNLHMDLKLNRFPNDKSGKEKRKRLQSALEEVKSFLMSIIDKNDSDSFDVSIPELSIPMIGDAKAKRKNERKAPKVTKVKAKKIAVDGGSGKVEDGKGVKEKSQEKRRVGNPFDGVGKMGTRHNPKKQQAYVKFTMDKNATNLLLSLRLDDGTDPTCDTYSMSERLIIKDTYCNGKKCQVINNDTVDVGKVDRGEYLDLVIDYETNIKGNYSIDYEFLNSALKKDSK